MLIMECEQGSDAWHAGRLAIPTASAFDKIITPTGKASTQAEGYMNRLLAEWLMGKPVDIEKSEWMLRGNELEEQARCYHAFTEDVHVQKVGLVYLDEVKMVAASPDGLIGEDGGLEIKCPAPWTHVGYLLGGKCPTDYIPQIQGNMYVTGRKWWTFLSYHPDMEPMMVKVERDDEYIRTMQKMLNEFIEKLLHRREKLSHLKR